MGEEGAGRLSGQGRRLIVLAALIGITHVVIFASNWCGPFTVTRTILSYVSAAMMILLPLLLLWRIPRVAGFDLAWMRNTRAHWGLTVALLVATLVLMFAGGSLIKAGVLNYHRPALLRLVSPVLVVMAAILGIIVVPFAEELFWRGYVQDQLCFLVPRPAAVVIQATLFGLGHVAEYGSAAVIPAGLGLIFGLWRLRMRTLVPLIVMHMLMNGLTLGPNSWAIYKESVRLNAIVAESPEAGQILTDIYQELESVRKSPKGKQIDIFVAQGGDEAIGNIIPFMGDENEDVASYAAVVLQACFPHQHSSHYDDALQSKNPRLLGNVISLMGALRWAAYAPRIYDIALAHLDLKVQLAGVLALHDFGDKDRLRRIAQQHQDKITSKAARNALKQLTEK